MSDLLILTGRGLNVRVTNYACESQFGQNSHLQVGVDMALL